VFDDTIRMNHRSAFLMTKYALPHFHGNIVSAGSEAGFNGLAYNTPYSGTKGWMHSFRRVSLSDKPNTVSAPTACQPHRYRLTHKETGLMDGRWKRIDPSYPLARRGTTEEVANVYAFIAS